MVSPVVIGDREVFTNASAGVVVSGSQYSSAEDLLRDADTAMYHAKAGGKSRFAVFEDGMNARAMRRLEIESDLHRALANNQFVVYYQPIVALTDGAMLEVEALVRWNRPNRGLVMPADFIPIAEETGLIFELGHWVLKQACQQAMEWHTNLMQQRPLRVSVNVSAKQLYRPSFVPMVREVLRETGLPGNMLKLEIAESVLMQERDAVIPTLNQLKEMGIKLAIDDFGASYTSMAYVSTLPIDTIKIDKEFIQKIGCREEHAIIEAIFALAKVLNVDITSEGIETADQLSELRTMGCSHGQGHYLARPMPAEHIGMLFMLPGQLNVFDDLGAIVDSRRAA
jgi:EAL domain-containing protein (putative c-di-GMP-specific phosphodiesterase class I)